MFLSVSYDIKYQRELGSTWQPPETKNIPEQAAVQQCRHTHIQQQQAATAHSTATFSSTLGAAPVPKQSCHNKELSKHIHSVLL